MKFYFIIIYVFIIHLGMQCQSFHYKNYVKMTHNQHAMHGMYGNYPMTREASGTSWLPDSSPMEGFLKQYKEWTGMFQGFSYVVADFQGGKRGGKKIFDENMIMCVFQKNFCFSTLAFRTMFSAEPATIGKCGYPLLLQTGETCDGKTPLINRQHPHDLFMELAFVYSYQLKQYSSLFFYFGLPGEPALGPPVYFMRFSGTYIPETPIGHHWMDSTHIVFGVITAGFIKHGFKFEISGFRGREPDQFRYDIEKPKIDSYSIRLSFNPTKNLALQISYGFLKAPEQLEPQVNKNKYIASVMYNKKNNNYNFQTTAVLGINQDMPGHTLPAFLFEATYEWCMMHLFFTRFEIVTKDDLFLKGDPLFNKKFTVEKLTFGYVYEFLTKNHVKWGIGGLIDFPIVPSRIKNRYGHTTSGMIFLQIRLI